MRKPATILILMFSLSVIFGSVAFAAEPTVDVEVVDSSGDPVVTATPGENVNVTVLASANDETIQDPWVKVNTTPITGLTLDTDNAVMWNGLQWISNSDPIEGGFLIWSDQHEGWLWLIDQVWGPMLPNDVTALVIPAKVTDTGEITTDATLFDDLREVEDSDSFTFLSVDPSTAAAGTVPMQDTGVPVAVAALGLLGIIGGTIYSRLR